MHVREWQACNIVEQFAIGSQFGLTRITRGRSFVFLGSADGLAGLYSQAIALLDSVQEVFTDHALDSLPVLRADGITGLEVGFGGPKLVGKAWQQNGEETDGQQKWQDRGPIPSFEFHLITA